MAFWKMVGFEVTPRMPVVDQAPAGRPPRMEGRDRLSIQGLWPNSV